LINLASYFEVVPLGWTKNDISGEKFSLDFDLFLWANELLGAKKLENLLLSWTSEQDCEYLKDESAI